MAIKIALAGNPNCGKTTLFNALTGANQYVGNWPGVTVEKKEGKLRTDKKVTIMDLPGIYSLSPYTPEEVVARQYLIDERPDAIINIVDGTNIERNLYLTTQLLELGFPVVIAVNMMDLVQKSGDRIDIKALGKSLGCEAVELSALKGTGVDETVKRALAAVKAGKAAQSKVAFDAGAEKIIAEVEEKLRGVVAAQQRRFFAIKLLENDSKIREGTKALPDVDAQIKALEDRYDDDAQSIIINERYTYITDVVQKCVQKAEGGEKLTTSDKIDKIVTNRLLALPIFAVVMFLVYYIAMSTIGAAATDWTNDNLFGDGSHSIPSYIEMGLDAANCADWLKGLILDGIVAGVGAVLGFVPQMLVLFFLLGFLEYCGYMARVAFIMDRIFRRFGLSGRSFIPMLVSTGCGVPGIMASRTIKNEKDRRMTIITTTFIPCGAKMPFIAMIAGAVFGGSAMISTGAYFIGVAAVISSGIILKKTRLFAGDPAPFVMELPSYHMPAVGSVLRSMWERGWSFIKKAGTIITLSTILVWFATYFGFVDGRFTMLTESQIDNSILAVLGNAVAWLFIPQGWGTWQAVVASITGLVAKENIVSTMEILYGGAGDTVYQAVGAAFTQAAGLSFLLFNLLCAPCFAAMGAIKREMNNTKWFWFAVGYQCGFAYLVSLVVYQLAELITTGSFGFWTVIAAALLLGFLYLLLRPTRNMAEKGSFAAQVRRGKRFY